jgi:hypothetical protein
LTTTSYLKYLVAKVESDDDKLNDQEKTHSRRKKIKMIASVSLCMLRSRGRVRNYHKDFISTSKRIF